MNRKRGPMKQARVKLSTPTDTPRSVCPLLVVPCKPRKRSGSSFCPRRPSRRLRPLCAPPGSPPRGPPRCSAGESGLLRFLFLLESVLRVAVRALLRLATRIPDVAAFLAYPVRHDLTSVFHIRMSRSRRGILSSPVYGAQRAAGENVPRGMPAPVRIPGRPAGLMRPKEAETCRGRLTQRRPNATVIMKRCT